MLTLIVSDRDGPIRQWRLRTLPTIVREDATWLQSERVLSVTVEWLGTPANAPLVGLRKGSSWECRPVALRHPADHRAGRFTGIAELRPPELASTFDDERAYQLVIVAGDHEIFARALKPPPTTSPASQSITDPALLLAALRDRLNSIPEGFEHTAWGDDVLVLSERCLRFGGELRISVDALSRRLDVLGVEQTTAEVVNQAFKRLSIVTKRQGPSQMALSHQTHYSAGVVILRTLELIDEMRRCSEGLADPFVVSDVGKWFKSAAGLPSTVQAWCAVMADVASQLVHGEDIDEPRFSNRRDRLSALDNPIVGVDRQLNARIADLVQEDEP